MDCPECKKRGIESRLKIYDSRGYSWHLTIRRRKCFTCGLRIESHESIKEAVVLHNSTYSPNNVP